VRWTRIGTQFKPSAAALEIFRKGDQLFPRGFIDRRCIGIEDHADKGRLRRR